jgi:glucose/arabinose dehydrogenase
MNTTSRLGFARARWLAAMLVTASGCGSSGSPSAPPPPGTCAGAAADAWVSDSHYCVRVFASGLGPARQMAFAPNGDLFVNNGKVTVLFDDDGNGASSGGERATFATAPGINHGIAFSRDGQFLYASSETAVYRWPYTSGSRKASGDAQLVVANIPSGGHVTRTLAFDSQGRLYVSVGSSTNVEVDPALIQTRAQVRRFAIPGALAAGGIDYATGEVVAWGMRNEVGLYVDARDRIWGVENGRDDLAMAGTDIHNDNPGEEVNLIDGAGTTYYGYPKCFTAFNYPRGSAPGVQYADATVPVADPMTDAQCRDPAQVHPAAFVLPGHWAPLGVLEYQGDMLPFGHDLIVTAHGSWDAQPAVGRVIARLH